MSTSKVTRYEICVQFVNNEPLFRSFFITRARISADARLSAEMQARVIEKLRTKELKIEENLDQIIKKISK